MRLPTAFVVPRPKRWTDQYPEIAPRIALNRVVDVVLESMADRQRATINRLIALVDADRRRP